MPPVDLDTGIRSNFAESIRTKQQTLDRIAPAIARAAQSLWQACTGGGKVLCCGNGDIGICVPGPSTARIQEVYIRKSISGHTLPV